MAASRSIFIDVNPLADSHLTGIGRYTARLALALAQQAGGTVRFTSQQFEVIAPRGLSWDQDQDLAAGDVASGAASACPSPKSTSPPTRWPFLAVCASTTADSPLK